MAAKLNNASRKLNDSLILQYRLTFNETFFMNWTVLIIFGIVILAFIVFLVIRNQKDGKDFEEQLKNDYHKSKDEEGDAEIDQKMK